MDYIKIGEFITSERKAKNLTQAKLAEQLFVSEKTLSKWENGNGVPDTEFLPKLCEIFNVSINELLNGERVGNDEYKSSAENTILALQKDNESHTKFLLRLEIIIGIILAVFSLSIIVFMCLVSVAEWIKIVVIALSVAAFFSVGLCLVKIEQVAGYYECAKCKHKYIPTYLQVNLSQHLGRTRYLKCPNCGKKSWNKKVIK